MRSDPGVVRNYGKLLLEMVSIVPDGIVCFFVSYSYMDGIINTWNDTGILKVRGSCGLSFICCAMNLAIIHSFLVSDLPFLFLAPYDFVVNLLDNSTILILEADLYHFPDEMLLIHQEIMQHKLVFIETQDVVETTLALDNYRKACDCGRGAVFFSVARYY